MRLLFWKPIIFRFNPSDFLGVQSVQSIQPASTPPDGQLGTPSCSKWLFGRKAEYRPLPSSLEVASFERTSLFGKMPPKNVKIRPHVFARLQNKQSGFQKKVALRIREKINKYTAFEC